MKIKFQETSINLHEMDFLLSIISLIIVFLTHNLYKRLKFKLPPGPLPWTILGNIYHLNNVRIHSFYDWSQIYGPIISVWLGSDLNIVVSSSELAKQVLKDNDQQLANRQRKTLVSKVTRNGKDLIWADYGSHYVKIRKICMTELFSPKVVESFQMIREEEVRIMVERVFTDFCNNKNSKSLVMRKYLGSVALNNVTRIVFGKPFENENGELNEYGLKFSAIMGNEMELATSTAVVEDVWWLGLLSWLKNRSFIEHVAFRDSLVRDIMDEYNKYDSERSEIGSKQHFLGVLLNLRERYELSEDTIIGLLWDMISAGTDTIAIAAEWAMAQLIKNPRVLQKAQEELDRVIGSRQTMTESDIRNLPYLQCVTKEALRLHPPTPLLLPHKASANVKVGGYDIPKGSSIHVSVWAIGRDPKIWKSPLEFRPERFLEEDINMKGQDFRLLPFGAGRRICPATQLSINLVTLMLGNLLHSFCWTLPQGVQQHQLDMSESPGLVSYMQVPLRAVPTTRLPVNLYRRAPVDLENSV